MVTQRSVTRWLVAGALLALGTTAASAGEWRSPFLGLTGTWNNDFSGENIKIGPASFGYEAWISNSGEARITTDSAEGSNIKIEGRDLACTYYVTRVSERRMNWQLRQGDKDKCLSGGFTKLETIVEVVYHKPVVWHPVWHRRYCRCY
jgi:hypothetical protein